MPADVELSNAVISMVLRFVNRRAGDAAVATVLADAGETRSLVVLHDLTGWSSWQQGRAITKAAARLLGGSHVLREVGRDWARVDAAGEITSVLQSLGSPEAVLEAITSAAARYSPHIRMQPVEINDRMGIVDAFEVDGYPRYQELCDFTAGVIAIAPMLFGNGPAEVEQTQCTLRGDDRCRYRVTWGVDPDSATTERFLREQLASLVARFDAFKATASDLVSGDDIEVLLEKITVRAATAVRAAGFVLAVDLPGLGQRAHGSGTALYQLDEVAGRLLRGDAAPESWLVADVASGRWTYGRLAAIFPGGSAALPEERSLLQSYAGLAAAALDAATALDRAVTERGTAEALWGLAKDLAAVSDRDQVAERLARAVPKVVGCDRAAVFLYDAAARCLRCAAVDGFEPAAAAAVLGLELSPADAPVLGKVVDEPRPRILTLRNKDPFLRGLLDVSGVEQALLVPLSRRGRLYGIVAASVADARAEIDAEDNLLARLQGLADQAVTAIENADLVAEAQHRAAHDPLTGLPNRVVLHDRVRQAQERPSGVGAALLFVDLDNFKTINDSLGHTAGDLALVEAGRRLSSCVRPHDTVVRLGGDEFAVLLEAASEAEATAVADRMLQVLAEPFDLDGRRVPLHASIGIATGVTGDVDADGPLRNADMAMYVAKAAGKRRHAAYDPEMHAEAVTRLDLGGALDEALQRDELEVHYQPLVEPSSGRIGALEALVRWRHPTLGLLLPGQFLPVAREVGLARRIDSWVLETAIRRARHWQERWPEVRRLGVSVNVSPDHLDDFLVAEVAGLLAESGLEPVRLVLEVTEDRSVVDLLAAASVIEELRSMGVRTALDDFGTGYSALIYLEQLHVDFVKIDRQLAGRAAYEPRSAALVAGVLDICRTIGVRTVAEGVETPAQLEHATAMGVDYVQGFLFAPGLPAAEAEALVQTSFDQRPTFAV